MGEEFGRGKGCIPRHGKRRNGGVRSAAGGPRPAASKPDFGESRRRRGAEATVDAKCVQMCTDS